MSDDFVRIGRHCLAGKTGAPIVRLKLRKEITEWIVSRVGAMEFIEDAGEYNWNWVPYHNKDDDIVGAEVWIRDPQTRLLFKLTFGGA